MSQAANFKTEFRRTQDRVVGNNDQPKAAVRLLEDVYNKFTSKESINNAVGDITSYSSPMGINRVKLFEAMITILSKVGNGTYDLQHPRSTREKLLAQVPALYGIEKISKNGGHIELDCSREKTLKCGKVPVTIGKHVSFDLEAKDTNHMKIKNIEGMAAQTPLGKTPVRELEIDRNASGRIMVTATIEIAGRLVKLPPVAVPVGGSLMQMARA